MNILLIKIDIFRYIWVRWIVSLLFGTGLLAYGYSIGYMSKSLEQSVENKINVPVRHNTKQDGDSYQGEQELLRYAFVDPVSESDLYYPAISTLADIRNANDRIFMLRDGFEGAYASVQIIGAEQVLRVAEAQPVVKIRFRYQEREYEAFAYGMLPGSGEATEVASLIIPGSGLNQSLSIAIGDPKNYQYGILGVLKRKGEVYTYIKPNEDYLAWHNGHGKKISGSFIWNWHLNRDGSYSVSYIVETLAIIKWIQSLYKTSIVAGLSQGGAAALINSLQSNPSFSIVGSGYTTLNECVEWSNHDQIISVPGYSELSNDGNLADKLNKTTTSWFFSWGRNETGSYKIEAMESVAANAIRHLPNVTVCIHDGGHVYPIMEVQSFLTRVRAKGSMLRLLQ